MSPAGRRRRRRRATLALLAVAVFLVLWRAAGSPLTTEDVRWLDLAVHGHPEGSADGHGAHLLLLRLFVAAAGDPFAGARALSATLLTLALVAAAAGAGALVPPGRGGLAAGLVLLAQPFLFAATGSVPPELTAMAWIGLGLVIALKHPTLDDSVAGGRSAGRRRDAFLLGAVTALAWRSDPSGLVLLWPAVLLLREDGRWSPARSIGRVLAWLAGGVLALGAVAAGLALTAGRIAAAGAPLAARAAESAGWVEVLWPGRAGAGGSGGMRFLALLVVGAVVMTTGAGRGLERRVAHLTPLVFVAALLLRPLFGGPRPAPVDLLPILPTACLFGAALFAYTGADRPGEGRPALLARLIPLLTLAAVALLVEPYLAGRLEAHTLMPWLHPTTAMDQLRRTVVPGVGIVLLIGAALALRWRGLRPSLLLAVALLALGPAVVTTGRLLGERRPAGRAAAALGLWTAFDTEIRAAEPDRIGVGRRLLAPEALGAAETFRATGRLLFDDPGLEVTVRRSRMKDADLLLVAAESEIPPRRTLLARDDERGIALLGVGGKTRGADRKTTRELRRRERRERRQADRAADTGSDAG